MARRDHRWKVVGGNSIFHAANATCCACSSARAGNDPTTFSPRKCPFCLCHNSSKSCLLWAPSDCTFAGWEMCTELNPKSHHWHLCVCVCVCHFCSSVGSLFQGCFFSPSRRNQISFALSVYQGAHMFPTAYWKLKRPWIQHPPCKCERLAWCPSSVPWRKTILFFIPLY